LIVLFPTDNSPESDIAIIPTLALGKPPIPGLRPSLQAFRPMAQLCNATLIQRKSLEPKQDYLSNTPPFTLVRPDGSLLCMHQISFFCCAIAWGHRITNNSRSRPQPCIILLRIHIPKYQGISNTSPAWAVTLNDSQRFWLDQALLSSCTPRLEVKTDPPPVATDVEAAQPGLAPSSVPRGRSRSPSCALSRTTSRGPRGIQNGFLYLVIRPAGNVVSIWGLPQYL
jgi:hypothetical protein